MQPETADAILASTQAGCPVPRFLGNKALTSTGDVSYTLGNNDHEDLDDAPGFALWLQRSAELERWEGTVDGWGLLFAWTSLMDGEAGELEGKALGFRLAHGVWATWDGRVMRHSSLAARIDKRIEDLYGLFISTSCENNRVANAYSGHPVDERGRGAPDEATCAKIDAWSARAGDVGFDFASAHARSRCVRTLHARQRSEREAPYCPPSHKLDNGGRPARLAGSTGQRQQAYVRALAQSRKKRRFVNNRLRLGVPPPAEVNMATLSPERGTHMRVVVTLADGVTTSVLTVGRL